MEANKKPEPKSCRKYRVALVGCGAIAPIHIPAILNAGNVLCGLCDIRPEQATALKERFQLAEAEIFTDYESMLETVHPDAVHICTPHYLHAQMAVSALNKGIHVLCEKPLAISSEQLNEIGTAVRNSNATLGVCLQNRYAKTNRTVKESADRIGVEAAFGDVVWKRDADYYRSGDWRGKWTTEGGGVMINQALHTLDLLQWICGMPQTVTAHCFNDHLQDDIEVEDTAVGRFEVGDKVFQIFATTGAQKDFSAHIRLKLKDKTVIHVENGLLDVNGDPQLTAALLPGGGKEVWGDGHKALIADYYTCLRKKIPFPVDFSEGAKVIRLILAMYDSDGKKVSVPEQI